MPFGWVAAAGVASSLIGANASQSAADTQAGAANNATQFSKDQWAQIMGNLQPYINQGTQANTRLGDLLGTSGNTGASGYGQLTQGFTPQDFQANLDPGYGFQLQQGQQALQNSQAAGDGVLSGSALKGLMSFNQNMANTAYQNAYSRWNSTNTNTYNRLAGLAQLGQSSAAGAAASGVNLAGTVSNNMIGAGNAQAAGQVGVANALGGGLSNAATGYYALNNLGSQQPTGSGGNLGWDSILYGTGGSGD